MLDDKFILGPTTRDYVKAIYFSNSGANNMQDFKQNASQMLNEMKALQLAIRKIMSVDKLYDF